MLATDVGQMSTRLTAAYTKIGELIDGRQSATDGSVGDRTELLLLSYRLFREAPLLGVGARGWNDAVARLVREPDPKDRVGIAYNQAHNQYADDLAKGGIVRFLLGFLVLFLPLFLFFRCEPYSEREGSEFALAGIVVSVGFMIFCLSESLMILSLTNTVQTSLVFYLLGGCDAVRRKPAAVASSAGSREVRNPLAAQQPDGAARAARNAISSPRASARPPAGRPRPAG
jgi:O-antigen ligase